jgi:hypothetical protein
MFTSIYGRRPIGWKRCVLNYFAKHTECENYLHMLLELIPVFASLFNTDKMPKMTFI